jgi:hypothetical protein
MTQADRVHSTPRLNTPVDPARRRFLSTAAGVAAGSAVMMAATTMAAPAIVSHGGPDPILAAIEAHKAALAAVLAQLEIQTSLEIELPREKRQSVVNVWEELIIFDDDPRWIECGRAVHELWDAESDAAIELVTVVPTTTAGLIALLQYAISADPDGETWPQDLQNDGDDRKWGHSWHHFLIQNVAKILPSMVGAAV